MKLTDLNKGQVITLKKEGKFYNGLLAHMSKQFKGISEITCAYVNSDKRVYAAEWTDSKGVFNFNGGFAPDIFATIKFN